MKRACLSFILGLVALAVPGFARAEAVDLQLAPLEYDQTISGSTPQQGFIDVSNPGDSTVNLQTSVQGFRQTDRQGNLAYYDNSALADAIKPGLSTFSLGPREAVRMTFTVDPTKLPRGGVYAVIFFKTIPADQNATSSFVTESAKVGTLLILNNGGIAASAGRVTRVAAPWLQLGSGLRGTTTFQVGASAVGVQTQLRATAYPWGHRAQLTGGLVLPGAARDFDFTRPGSYFGPVPVTVTDAVTGTSATAWVLACTGWYRLLFVIVLAGLAVLWFLRRRAKRLL